MKQIYKFESEVTLYPGMGGWHFGHLEKEMSAEIKKLQTGIRRGFGSVKIGITAGQTTWNTSLFPNKKTGTYIFPIKASVRKREMIFPGDKVQFSIELV